MGTNSSRSLRDILFTAVTAAGMLFGKVSELRSQEPLPTPDESPTLLIAGGVIMKPGIWADKERCGAPWSAMPQKDLDPWGFFAKAVELTGKENPNIVIITSAAGDDATVLGENYVEILKSLFPGSVVHYIDYVTPEKDAKFKQFISDAHLLIGTGGDQWDALNAFGTKTETYAALQKFKGVFATNSALSMTLGEGVLRRPDKFIKAMDIETRPGWGFVKKAVIDTHMKRIDSAMEAENISGRWDRLLDAMERYPGFSGFGVDERTALIKKNNTCTVFGEQSAYFAVPQGRAHSFSEDKMLRYRPDVKTVFEFRNDDRFCSEKLRMEPKLNPQSQSPARQR